MDSTEIVSLILYKCTQGIKNETIINVSMIDTSRESAHSFKSNGKPID